MSCRPTPLPARAPIPAGWRLWSHGDEAATYRSILGTERPQGVILIERCCDGSQLAPIARLTSRRRWPADALIRAARRWSRSGAVRSCSGHALGDQAVGRVVSKLSVRLSPSRPIVVSGKMSVACRTYRSGIEHLGAEVGQPEAPGMFASPGDGRRLQKTACGGWRPRSRRRAGSP